jgi:hypothetical protein
VLGPVLLYLLLGGPTAAVPHTETLKTQAALAAHFEVLHKASFVAPFLGNGFALSNDEKLLYFTERTRDGKELDLMAFDLARDESTPVMPLCGAPDSEPASQVCLLPDTYIAALPASPRRLLIAQADPPRPYSSVYVLELRRRQRTPLSLGSSPRRTLLQSKGVDARLGTSADMQVSPSGKFLLATLHLLDQTSYYDDTDYGIFSLETGRREFLYHLPVQVVGDHEETALSAAWWGTSDVLVLHMWGGTEDKLVSFERDEHGKWHERTMPAPPKPNSYSTTFRRMPGDQALVGTDAEDRGGFLIDSDLLFGADKGIISTFESHTSIVIINVLRSLARNARVDVVVLWPARKVTPTEAHKF